MPEKPLRVMDPAGEAQFFETVLRCVADGVVWIVGSPIHRGRRRAYIKIPLHGIDFALHPIHVT